MKKQPKVSIILLNFNEEKHTLECLKSLNKLNYENYRIIIVDNGSKNKSVESIKKKIKNQKHIKLIEANENKGFTEGNNIGIIEALKDKKINYLLLLNNDTVVETDFLKILVNFSENWKNVGVVSPKINKYSNKREINPTNLSGKFNLWIGGGRPIRPKKRAYETDYNSGCCWLIKRKVIEEAGLFKKIYFIYKEEIELAYRIKKQGYKFFVIPNSVIYHKGEATTKKMSGFRQYHETKNALFFVREHGMLLQKVFFISYVLSYKVLKQLFLNLKSGENVTLKNKKFFKGIKEGLTLSYS
jgi:GT2 family glycosyltransferase